MLRPYDASGMPKPGEAGFNAGDHNRSMMGLDTSYQPKDLGYGIKQWDKDKTNEFYAYWDSPQRKENAARKQAEFDAMTPKQQEAHREGQKQVRRDLKRQEKWGGRSVASILREKAAAHKAANSGAVAQRKERLADPNSKLNQKRARRARRRMAGDEVNILDKHAIKGYKKKSRDFKY